VETTVSAGWKGVDGAEGVHFHVHLVDNLKGTSADAETVYTGLARVTAGLVYNIGRCQRFTLDIGGRDELVNLSAWPVFGAKARQQFVELLDRITQVLFEIHSSPQIGVSPYAHDNTEQHAHHRILSVPAIDRNEFGVEINTKVSLDEYSIHDAASARVKYTLTATLSTLLSVASRWGRRNRLCADKLEAPANDMPRSVMTTLSNSNCLSTAVFTMF
jgi:hypothetical protein